MNLIINHKDDWAINHLKFDLGQDSWFEKYLVSDVFSPSVINSCYVSIEIPILFI